MTSPTLSLTGAERGIPLLGVAAALVFAVLAATSARLAAFVLIGGLACFVVLRSLLAGLALFVVLTFPEQLPGTLGAGPTLAKPLGVIIVLSWLLLVVSDRERQMPFLPRDAPLATGALLALVVWSIASAAWAADSAIALSSAGRLAQLVGLVFVAYSALRTPRDVFVLLSAFLVGELMTASYALANGTLKAGRLTGGIFNPNSMAANLAAALLLMLFLFVAAPRTLHRVLLVPCAVIVGAAFILTQSRSGLIALSVAGVAGIVVAGPQRGRVTAIVLITAALGIGYYVFVAPPQLTARISTIVSGGQADPLREDTWHIALRMANDYPVAGVGLGNFPKVESRYVAGTLNVQKIGSLRRFQLVVHNTYLEFLAELGMVGIALFLTVLALTVGRAMGLLLRSGSQEGATLLLGRAIVAATIAILISQIFISGEYSKQLWLLLGMGLATAALAAHPRRVHAREEQRVTQRLHALQA